MNRRRLASVAALVAALVITNLAVYWIGRALGGAFTFTGDNGDIVRPDTFEITVMSLVPLYVAFTLIPVSIGLRLGADLLPRWSKAIRIAGLAVCAVVMAVIAFVTLPAGFDTTSAVSLGVMYLAATVAGLAAVAIVSSAERSPRNP
jgi:hypothetical protein